MKCNKCGLLLNEDDKFCRECGEIIIKRKKNKIKNQGKSELQEDIQNKKKQLSFKWLKFYIYFRIPFGLFIVLLGFKEIIIEPIKMISTYNWLGILIVIIYLIYLILALITFAFWLLKNKYWYNSINILLFFETVWVSINANVNANSVNDFFGIFSLYIIIFGLIWFLPNYIYFEKRKNAHIVLK